MQASLNYGPLLIRNDEIAMRIASILTYMILSVNIHALSLVNIIALSQKDDPEYHSKIQAYQAAQLSEKSAAHALLPNLNLSLNASKSSTEASGAMTVSSEIPLYNPVGLQALVAGRLKKNIAHLEEASYKTNHTLSLINSYFDVLKAVTAYQAKQTALKQNEHAFKETLALEQAGMKTHVDTLQSKSYLDLGILAVTVAKNNLDRTVTLLENKINAPITVLNRLPDNFTPNFAPLDVPQLVSDALNNNTALRISQIKTQQMKQQMNAAYARLQPKVTLNVSASQNINSLKNGILPQEDRSTSASIQMSFNLFSGMKDFYTTKQERLNYLSAESALSNEVYNTKHEMESSYRQHQNAKLKVLASLSALQSSKASLDALLEKRQEDEASELEIMKAITQSETATQEYSNACYDLLSTYITIKAQANALTPQVVEEIDQYLTEEIPIDLKAHPSAAI